MATLPILPPRSALADAETEKGYRTGISLWRYQLLTTEAFERGGMTIYQLTRSVMTLYADKKLVAFDDLPADIQQQIRDFYSKPVSPAKPA